MSSDSFKNYVTYKIIIYNIYIYNAPPWGLSTQVKEFMMDTRIMQSSSNELRYLVRQKCK